MDPILMALLGIGGAVAGGLNNSKAARTSEYDQDQQGSGSTQSSAANSNTIRRDLTDEQRTALQQLFGFGSGLVQNPMSGLEAIKSAALNQTNSNYGGVMDALKAKLLASGQAASGKFARGARATELARIGDISGLEGQFAQMGNQRQLAGAGILQNILGMNFGETSTGQASNVGATSNQGRNWGTGVAPGSAAGGALSGGLGALSSALGLQSILAAGRRPGGGGFNQGGYDYLMGGGYL